MARPRGALDGFTAHVFTVGEGGVSVWSSDADGGGGSVKRVGVL